MAIINTTRPVPFGAVATSTVVNIFSNMFNGLAMAYNANKTRSVLTNLSNSQLDDIGVMPGDIAKIAHRVTLLH